MKSDFACKHVLILRDEYFVAADLKRALLKAYPADTALVAGASR